MKIKNSIRTHIIVWFNIKFDFSIFDHTSVYTNRAENYQIAFVRPIRYNNLTWRQKKQLQLLTIVNKKSPKSLETKGDIGERVNKYSL